MDAEPYTLYFGHFLVGASLVMLTIMIEQIAGRMLEHDVIEGTL